MTENNEQAQNASSASENENTINEASKDTEVVASESANTEDVAVASATDNGASESTPEVPSQPASDNASQETPDPSPETQKAFVAPHVYDAPKVEIPSRVPEPPTSKPLYREPVASPEPSHAHKPWFYAVAGGVVGLLIGAACAAGCTSLAFHTGLSYKPIVVTPSLQTESETQIENNAADEQSDRNSENRERDTQNDLYDDRDTQRGYGYGYPAPYGYGYGYGQNPYGYGYGYPYGYGYGYTNPYGYGYDYDLEDLYEYLYGDDSNDTRRDSESDTQQDSEDKGSQEDKSAESDSYEGIIDLNELFGGSSSSSDSSSVAPVTLEEIVENFDLPEGDVTGDTHSAGVYTVGKDGIEPGLYYLEGSQSKESNFYVYELEDDDRKDAYELESAIAYIGSYFVELEKGDVIVYKPADEASEFYAAEDAPKVTSSPYGSGLYRVGTDIPAGTYTITASSEKIENASQDRAVYVMKDIDFDDDSILETKYVMPGGSQTIEVKDGQWIELYGTQAELQK